MRMLVILLLLLNGGLAGYYLFIDDTPNAPPARPTPGEGSLTLISETGLPRTASLRENGRPSNVNITCWQSIPINRGEQLDQLKARVTQAGYQVREVTSGGDGRRVYSVRLGQAETIQQAAAHLVRASDAGLNEARVQPLASGALAIIAGRYVDRDQAQARLRAVEKLGLDARIHEQLPSDDTVRLTVSGASSRSPPNGVASWEPTNCQ